MILVGVPRNSTKALILVLKISVTVHKYKMTTITTIQWRLCWLHAVIALRSRMAVTQHRRTLPLEEDNYKFLALMSCFKTRRISSNFLQAKNYVTRCKSLRNDAIGRSNICGTFLVSEGKLSVMHSLRQSGKNSCQNCLVHPKCSQVLNPTSGNETLRFWQIWTQYPKLEVGSEPPFSKMGLWWYCSRFGLSINSWELVITNTPPPCPPPPHYNGTLGF